MPVDYSKDVLSYSVDQLDNVSMKVNQVMSAKKGLKSARWVGLHVDFDLLIELRLPVQLEVAY